MVTELRTDLDTTKGVQPVSRLTSQANPLNSDSLPEEFSKLMTKLLGVSPEKNVSEEALFSALVKERIQESKGDEALQRYEELFNKQQLAHTRADGVVSVEDATRAALKEFRDSGELTAEEADQIHTAAFNSAQLDDNLDALWDDRGGPGDATIAVQSMEAALMTAHAKLASIGDSTLADQLKPLDGNYSSSSPAKGASGNSGNAVDATGSGDFVYKPVSDTTGNLVVLLPSSLTGDVDKVLLKDSAGQIIEEGIFSSVANGNREHFRFSKPGAKYQDNIMIEVMLKNGETKSFDIPDSSQRYG